MPRAFWCAAWAKSMEWLHQPDKRMPPKRAALKWERAYKPGSVIGNHLSRLCVTAKLKHATRMHGRAAVWHSYLRLLQMGFTKLRCCQRTVSAFLLQAGESSFLWHCPSGCPAQPLAGILPFGARTFLMLAHAAARLTRGGSIHRSSNDVYGRRCELFSCFILPLQAGLTGEIIHCSTNNVLN